VCLVFGSHTSALDIGQKTNETFFNMLYQLQFIEQIVSLCNALNVYPGDTNFMGRSDGHEIPRRF